MNTKKTALIALFITAVTLFFMLNLDQYLSLAFIKSTQATVDSYYILHPLRTSLIFFISYILVTGFSLPGAAILTLAGGAVFGIIWGTILVSFGSVFGATIAFLMTRYLLHDYVQTHFGKYLAPINRGIKKEGHLYLFTIRIVPIFPFFMVNILMALTPIKTLNFALVSQIAMLIPTIIFVNAGTQLARIESLDDVLSPALMLSFALLGLFPFVAKKTLAYIEKKRNALAATANDV